MVSGSTIATNSAGGDGGGIYNEDILTLPNSTVAGNSAGNVGGGIFNDVTLTAVNTTIGYNIVAIGGTGGGLDAAAGKSTLNNTIVRGSNVRLVGSSSAPDDVAGTLSTSSTIQPDRRRRRRWADQWYQRQPGRGRQPGSGAIDKQRRAYSDHRTIAGQPGRRRRLERPRWAGLRSSPASPAFSTARSISALSSCSRLWSQPSPSNGESPARPPCRPLRMVSACCRRAAITTFPGTTSTGCRSPSTNRKR